MGRTFRIVPNFSSFCLTDADLSLLSYHVSARTTLNMLAGAQRYICAFFGRLLKSSLFGCSDRQRKLSRIRLKSHFYLFFHFFAGWHARLSAESLHSANVRPRAAFFSALPRAPNSRVSGRLQPILCSSLPRGVRYWSHDLPKEEIPRQG